MKKEIKILLFTALLAICDTGYSKMINNPYEVGTWQGFRKAAISYTFDDGCSNQFAIALPMFDKFGFKMTLFTVTDWASRDKNWPALKAAASVGHEIASHTVTHPYLDKLSKEKQEIELKNSKEIIEANIPGPRCITIAWPYCRLGDVPLCEKYYIAARGCQGSIEKSTPGNFMNISSIICGSLGSIKNAENFTKRFEDTADSNGLCVLLIHGIDNDGGYSPLPSAELRSSLEYLAAHKDTFWVGTFVNAVRYIRERNAVSVKEISSKGNTITIQVTDTLDNAIYNYPITIRRPLPENWSAAKVIQNEKAVNASVVEVDSTKYIMFDVVPDGGDVVLSSNKK
jgi:hypothetical protein